ncbi:MAG: class I SAM-dependent methyltransferase [Chitinophagaceae bacterium]|nr:class I SAM-dependent methyltransferase [Chitinophagaceae bacterium]
MTKREPMLCPKCRSNDRDRFFWLFLEKNPDFFKPGIKLLHISPETIYYNRFKKIPDVDYTAGDKFVLQFGSTYPPDTIYLDITDMPEYPDNTFDFIFCSHVLEYINEDKKALKELYRVLKPGGKAIISVPINFGTYQTLEDPSVTDPKEQERLYGIQVICGTMEMIILKGYRRLALKSFHSVADFIAPEMIKKCVIKPLDIVHLCYK